MIPYTFHLFWAGNHLSYLRYLTFKSCRHHNPDARIILHHSPSYNSEINWVREKQDFQSNMGKNYFDHLKDINVEIIIDDEHKDLTPVFQADLLRWVWLYKEGGFYIDTDQIILKSFEGLLRPDFVYSSFHLKTGPYYHPIGVLGSIPEHLIPEIMIKQTQQHLNVRSYQSIGPPLFRTVMTSPQVTESRASVSNMPSYFFYPIPEPDGFCEKMFSGEEDPDISRSYALHWYGGYQPSHDFNAKYSEEFARTSNDSISKIIRENGII